MQSHRTIPPRAYSIFWSRVERTDGCWIWTGRREGRGYGRFGAAPRRWSAHRLAWTLTYGPIPDGMFVCHRCDNPPCVRPDHLFLGTNSDNLLDASRKGRIASGARNGAYTHPERRQRGEQINTAILTADQVREIRRRYASGERQIDIARAFGTRNTNVSRIVRRETWRHLL